MNVSEIVLNAFESLTPNLENLYEDSICYNLSSWRRRQCSLATASGALAMGIPGLHLAGVAADVLFLMNRMSVCSFGIGSIIGYNNGNGFMLEEEDFGLILARWGGCEEASNGALQTGVKEIGLKVGGKAATKALSKGVAKYAGKKVGIYVGEKVGGKIITKIAAKFGAKLGGKVAGGFIPLFGSVIGGSINLWFINSIADEAESYYKFKSSLG